MIVRDSPRSAYDCQYVVVAVSLGVKLNTMDATFRRAFLDRTIALPGS